MIDWFKRLQTFVSRAWVCQFTHHFISLSTHKGMYNRGITKIFWRKIKCLCLTIIWQQMVYINLHNKLELIWKLFQSCLLKFLFVVYFKVVSIWFFSTADPEGPGFCAFVLTFLAALLLMITLPFSLCTCIKVSSNWLKL